MNGLHKELRHEIFGSRDAVENLFSTFKEGAKSLDQISF